MTASALPTARATTRSSSIRIDDGGLVAFSEQGWMLQVGFERLELPADVTLDMAAERFVDLCNVVQGADKRCVLGLASSECFFAEFDLPETIDPKDRGAIRFELERHFPLDAEAMVAEFSVDTKRNQIAAIAIESGRHRPTIETLERFGVEVVSIIPTSFLIARAVQQWRNQRSPCQLLLFDHASAEQLSLDDDGVRQWRRFFSDEELRRHQTIRQDGENDRPTVVVVGRSELAFHPGGSVQWCDVSTNHLAAEGANLALRGRWGRWPDLRQGDLAPSDPLFAVSGPLRMLSLAATVCALALIGAAWYRTDQLRRASESVRQQQRAVFSEAYPDRRVPVLLMRTVRNEHRKTLGSRGRGDAVNLPVPATTVLRALFAGLQHARRDGEASFRLIDINILDGECSLTVRAIDSVQIGTLARSLETVGFQVAPPASEQIDPSREEPIATYQSTILAVWNATPTDSQRGQQR